MSQKFQVLKCFKCCTFQVHSVKKSTKWACKMCGENQSVKRNYGNGTGKECRLHVQSLNSMRWEIAESRDSLDTLEFNEEGTENSESWKNVESKNCIPSKWEQYVEFEKEPLPKLSEEIPEGAEVVLELPKNIPKKTLNKTTNNYITKRLKPLNPDAHEPETMHVLSNNYVHTKVPASKPLIDEIPSNLNDGKLIDRKFTVFEPCKLSKNSKWAKFVDENAEVEEMEGHSTDDACKVLAQPEVTKDPKCSQYIDNDGAIEDTENDESRELTSAVNFSVDAKVKGISFSQCSDEDIDHVLDF